jgi:xylulokinase
MYFLGYDIGSSSIKVSLFDAEKSTAIHSVSYPEKEMSIIALKPGFAEQHPADWWENLVKATHALIEASGIQGHLVEAIGISYQMHGLVLVDEQLEVIRPAIIWCDSRAVEIGNKAFQKIGPYVCLDHLLNSPGNFTASKMAWVKQNEPASYKKVHQVMVPGDYIALKMTGEARTTISGLSEGIWWDFKTNDLSELILAEYGFDSELFPPRVPTFGHQGGLTQAAARTLGLKSGTPLTYRAGDQPNNAFSLNVLEPGELAATAGTSGVVYGISDVRKYDRKSRINTFIHVNHNMPGDRYGVLLCLNGAGILNAWMRRNFNEDSYPLMNKLAGQVPVGSEGLFIFPFGNGAERMLENRDPGSRILGWQYNIHQKPHFFRAAQEAVAFAMFYGMKIMESVGTSSSVIRAGHANMFLSPVFSQTLADLTGATIELYDTDGAQGAARGAALGHRYYSDFDSAFSGLLKQETIRPSSLSGEVRAAYQEWEDQLNEILQGII